MFSNWCDSKKRTKSDNKDKSWSEITQNKVSPSTDIDEIDIFEYYQGLPDINQQKTKENFKYDDDKNYYKIFINDHIIKRYQILKSLGKGHLATLF